jgi:IPT/TIG domain-containing protein/galactose oxidase-like protein
MSRRTLVPRCVLASLGAVVLGGSIPAAAQVTWSPLSPATSPPPRAGHAMVYDSARGRTVLFGGYDPTFAYLSDTWEWDGTNWSQISTATSPSPRASAAAVYDPALGRVVLFGGVDGSGPLGETWEWDGTDWRQRTPPNFPGPRGAAAMAFDPSRNVDILFGGADSSGALSDTWMWNGTNWFALSPATTPTARGGHAMTYDPGTGHILMMGGVGTCTFSCPYIREQWEWDGTDWTQIFPANVPFAREQFGMAYDAVRGQTIVFGGHFCAPFGCFDRGDTWLYDGVDWTQQTVPQSPSVRYAVGMVYDAARSETLLFGGSTMEGDTWALDPPLSLTSIAPADGSEAGGDWINLYGTSFTTRADSSVTIGGAAAVVGDVLHGRMRVRTPAGSGVADVTLTNSLGTTSLRGAFTYVAPEIAARFGNVNVALGDRESPLTVNGGVGDASRVVSVPVGQPLGGAVASPSSLPTAHFCMYAWIGVPNLSTLTSLPRGLGFMVFPTPFAGSTPQPRFIFNNLGRTSILGSPNAPSSPAPSTLFSRPGGLSHPISVTFQGVIQDLGSIIDQQVSVTNAVIVRVTP